MPPPPAHTKDLQNAVERLVGHFRIHHSHLVNLKYIKRYIRGDGRQVVMQNGDIIDVARRKKEELLKLFDH